MIGLGVQELLLLAICCGFPLGAGVIVLIIVLTRQRNQVPPHQPHDNES